MKLRRILLLAVLLLLVLAFVGFELDRYFTLEYFQSQRASLLAYKDAHFWQFSLLFFILYLGIASLSLPFAAILTVAGGALFGLGWGLLLVSFASSLGATLAFLVSRSILREWVQKRFGSYFKTINRGIEKDGAFYLFSLRLVPGFPFFLVNLVMGLTSMRVLTFYIVSQLGMLPGTALYVNVGAQLGQASSLPEVLTLDVMLSFVAIALFPWIARGVNNRLKARKVYAGFSRPKKFDANLVVIGAGSAGLVTSLIGSLVKARVVLIEKHLMGGDCLNTGCVPSKALIKSASVNHLIGRAEEFGIEKFGIEELSIEQRRVNFPKVMQRVREVIRRIEPHDSVERYEGFGVECISGEARITSPFTVEVNGKEITTRNIVLATGASPLVPPIPGLEDVGYYTSDTIWSLEELPERLLVLGGGPIGCELAQAFSRLGSKVTQIDMASRIMPQEDPEVSTLVQQHFEKEGITVLTSHQVRSFELRESDRVVIAVHEGADKEIAFDAVLLAAGRKANVEGFGLEELKVPLTPTGTVEVNDYLQTRFPNIYACGDVAGPYQFTHMASHQAWYAAVNSLFGSLRKYRVNYRIVPWATFIDPEVARVGLNETEAEEREVSYEVTRYDLSDLDRAIADGEDRGFIKVLTVPGKDRILGVTIVGHRAGDLISEFVLAMTHNLGLKKLMATIHIYPTISEGNKFAASEWRKKHAPEWVYPWLEKFHRWGRR